MSGPPDILRIGVCGTAHWAEAVHLPALKEAPGFRLAGVYGRNLERIATLAEKFGILAFADFDAFLDAHDAVSFAVPPAVQERLALQAVKAGKQVIVEKPVAPTVKGAEAIGVAVEASGVGAVCFLTRNFIPELLDFTRKAAAAGVRTAEARFLSSALSPGSPYAGSIWRQEPNSTVWDIGPHLLTSLMNLLGPVESLAVRRTAEGGLKADLRHSDGRTSSFDANQRMPLGPLQEALIAQTDRGEMRLENFQYDRIAALGRAAAQLRRAVAGDAGARAAFDHAIHLVRILAAAEQSLNAGGTPVAIALASA
jgi:Oxidoreductase family, NAD-binding Rossmann fold